MPCIGPSQYISPDSLLVHMPLILMPQVTASSWRHWSLSIGSFSQSNLYNLSTSDPIARSFPLPSVIQQWFRPNSTTLPLATAADPENRLQASLGTYSTLYKTARFDLLHKDNIFICTLPDPSSFTTLLPTQHFQAHQTVEKFFNTSLFFVIWLYHTSSRLN